jgi:murein endopeptidase
VVRGQDLTPYQKGVVRRYYEHRDDLVHQKLSEIVSELYVCEDEQRAVRLWKSARTALMKTQAGKALVERIVAERDLKGLADLVNSLF